ncbi:response regulator transcription factor [Microbacterium sp. SD291]|uniref:response regulator transcription factor n=1 Tax=Microbacterium sp. SD291 TaxID=2782007 RepID=UPI001A97C6CC|nr:response regulator transcription factor [Microbacterium sp. SD291]
MIDVALADDHFLVREGTRRLLEESGRVRVVASVSDGAQLLEAVGRLAPDAVIVDIRMPPTHRMEGIETARAIRARHPRTGVVVLSQHASALYALELFRDGTDGLGYLLKERVGELDDLLGALTQVIDGGSVIDPIIVEALLQRQTSPSDRQLERLTGREREVLAAMAAGNSNSSIAGMLFLSQSAVEKHINSIFAKLDLAPEATGTHRRVAAVLAFLRADSLSE